MLTAFCGVIHRLSPICSQIITIDAVQIQICLPDLCGWRIDEDHVGKICDQAPSHIAYGFRIVLRLACMSRRA